MKNILLVLFFFVYSLSAQIKDTLKSYDLDEIEIESSIILQPLSVINIAPKEIELSDAQTFDELAPLLPSVKVQTNSRGETLFYFRNSGKRRLTLMFDGVPLNIPWDNRIDLSLIPTTAISKIIITKGIPSIIYGANSLAGVINISSLILEEKRQSSISLYGGENGKRGISGFFGEKINSYDLLFSAGYDNRDSFPLPKSFSSVANPTESRINSYSRGYNFFGKIKKHLSDNSEIGISISYLSKEKGVPPEIGVSKIRYWQYPELSDLSVTLNGIQKLNEKGNWFLTYTGNFTKYHSVINQFTDVTYSLLEEKEKGDDETIFGRAILTGLLSASSILRFSGSGYTSTHYETIYSDYVNRIANEINNNTYSQNVFSIGAEYEYLFNNLVMNVGVSYDGASTPKTGDKPKKNPTYDYGFNAGAVYTISKQFHFRLNVGRKTRFPTMREMYSGALGKFELNPELRAESAQSGELGIAYNFGFGSLESDVFLTYIKDGIVREKLSSGKYKRVNKSAIRNYGLETEFETALFKGLMLRTNASFINSFAQNSSGEFSDTLEYAPKIILGANLFYKVNNFGIVLEMNYIGDEYEAESYFVKLPDYLLTNIRLSYAFKFGSTKQELYFRINNIFDKLYYTQFGLPEAGRELTIGIKSKLFN